MNIQSIGTPQAKLNTATFKGLVRTEDMLKVATEYTFVPGGLNGYTRVCQEMAGVPFTIEELPEIGSQCAKVLRDTFPILDTIIKNTERFFSGSERPLQQVKKFLEEQVALFGSKEVDVPKITIDRSKVSERSRRILEEKLSRQA